MENVKKVLILDSGPLINLSMNGLLYILENLRKSFDGKFLITKNVKEEVYDRPLKIKRFELEALRIEELLNLKILELPQSVGINENELDRETKEIMNIANYSFKAEGQWINIISPAETSCLALSSLLTKKGIDNIIAIDERTARILSEKPENLEKLMSNKLHKRVTLENQNIKKLEKLRFIRSSELVYVAYKKGLARVKGKKALEALIYATKFKGASISWDEVDALRKM